MHASASQERTDEYNRVMSPTELNSLIADCEVESFSLQQALDDNYNEISDEQEVYVFYKNNYDSDGEWVWRAKTADPSAYEEYVQTAKDSQDSCNHLITYNNDFGKNDPDSSDHRYITVSEASGLLLDCEIKTFSYTNYENSFDEITFEGTDTGIKFVDYGWVKHLSISQDREATLIPIARDAQDVCGTNNPQFWYGNYEHL